MHTRSLSLATKTIALIVATLVVILGLTAFSQYRAEENTILTGMQDEANEVTTTLRMAMSYAMLKNDKESVEGAIRRVADLESIKRVYMLDPDGKLVRSSGDRTEARRDFERVKQTGHAAFEMRSTGDGKPYTMTLAPIPAEKDCLTCHSTAKEGEALGYVGLDHWADKDMKELRANEAATIWMHIGCILIISCILAYAVRRITRPLQTMTAVARKIAAGDVNQVLDFHSADELGMLSQSFRDLIGYIKGVAEAAERLSQGDMGVKVKQLSHHDILSKSFQSLIETMQQLTAEMGGLAAAAHSGELTRRGNPARFQGAYADLVRGMNDTMDAFSTPIEESSMVLQCVAEGDLAVRMTGDHKGQYKKIKDSLNEALVKLDQALSRAASASEQVTTAAGQIGGGSLALSQVASAGASSIEEISASLQELTSMTRQNAVSARQAKGLSEAAFTSASRGVDSMNRLSESIEKIKSSSSSTAKIVKTIDEIAFQTNLLALNAAVEAARAGDAGKGFAVVADEVRSLAMRSAEAAKSTAALIEESVKNAEGGYQINQEVIKNLDEINKGVTKVGEVITEIAAASEQQSQGVDQISSAIEQLNHATQQVATNAQQSSSATVELTGQARELQNMILRFKLSDGGKTKPQPKAAPHGTLPNASIPKKEAKALPPKANGSHRSDPRQLIPFEEGDKASLREF